MRSKRLYLRPEFWVGIIVLLGGIIHLLSKFDISLTMVLERYWPVLFILAGIGQMTSNRYRETSSIVVLILFGVVLMLFKEGFVTVNDLQENWPQSLLNLLENLLNFVTLVGKSLNITTGV